MTNLLKTVFLKTMVLVTLILAASLLVTCDGFLDTLQPEGDVEYTDVEYEVVGAKGNERVKSLKLYLRPDGVDEDALPGPKTYGVKKSAEQRRIERALTLEGARMSHDYFEAVFVNSASLIARAAWEIGQPAGISGVTRGGADYRSVDPTSLPASVVFVGRKTGKTLLGVGYLTHINNEAIGAAATPAYVVDNNTESVTFTVSALATWVGFNNSASPPAFTWVVNQTRKDVGTPGTGIDAGIATFVTSRKATGGAYTLANATEGNTDGETMSPRGTGGQFPLYFLPSAKAAGLDPNFTVAAQYKIGGLTAATVIGTGTDPIYATATFPTTLATAIRIWGKREGTLPYPKQTDTPNTLAGTATLKGGLQWIKRTPAFMSGGINYEVNDTFHDKVTQIVDYNDTLVGTTVLADLFPANDAQFPAGLPVMFRMYTAAARRSGGIFAATFQVPVYALISSRSTNSGTLPPERWWIRPDYSQYQYLLDNGVDSGGAVLLGTDVEGGGGDWIQINTVGIGFNNE
jgi:hypothetical protein